MSLAAGLATALQADSPLMFFAVEVIYPTFALRLLDGPGVTTIGGNTFTGLDPTWGALAGPEAFADGVAAEAPHLVFQIQAPTNAAAANLCDPAAQGSVVNLYLGAMNRATGQPVSSPYLMWTGSLDTMTLQVDRGARTVKLDAESSWDRFFDTDEGLLLDNSTHQALWPGELGCEYVTYVQVQLPWGADAPRPIVVKDVIGGQSPGTSSSGVGGYNPGAYPIVPGVGGGWASGLTFGPFG